MRVKNHTRRPDRNITTLVCIAINGKRSVELQVRNKEHMATDLAGVWMCVSFVGALTT